MVFTFSTRWRTRHTSTRRRACECTPLRRRHPSNRTDAHARHTHTYTHTRPFIRAPNRSPAALATAIDRKLPSPRRLLLLLRHSRNKKSVTFPPPPTTTISYYYYYLQFFSRFFLLMIPSTKEFTTTRRRSVRFARILKVTRGSVAPPPRVSSNVHNRLSFRGRDGFMVLI